MNATRWARRGVIAAAIAAVLAGGWAGRTALHHAAAQRSPVPVDQFIPPDQRPPAPQITGTLLDGGQFDLTAWRGQVIVVNWWGSWCGPCRKEAPELRAVQAATATSGVRFVGVNVKDQPQQAIAFERRYRIAYSSIFDPDGRVALQFSAVPPNAVPTTVVIDRQGRIAVVIPHALTRAALLPAVDQLAEQQRP